MMFGQNLAIYTVLYKESESEVKKFKILEPGGKTYIRKTNVKLKLSIFLFFNLNVGLFNRRYVACSDIVRPIVQTNIRQQLYWPLESYRAEFGNILKGNPI